MSFNLHLEVDRFCAEHTQSQFVDRPLHIGEIPHDSSIEAEVDIARLSVDLEHVIL